MWAILIHVVIAKRCSNGAGVLFNYVTLDKEEGKTTVISLNWRDSVY